VYKAEAKIKKPTAGHKEKSVLQAKLTKLTIKIGYVGQLDSCCHTHCIVLSSYKLVSDEMEVIRRGQSQAERTGAPLRHLFNFSRAALGHLYFSRGEFRLQKLRYTELCERGGGEEQGRNYITRKHND